MLMLASPTISILGHIHTIVHIHASAHLPHLLPCQSCNLCNNQYNFVLDSDHPPDSDEGVTNLGLKLPRTMSSGFSYSSELPSFSRVNSIPLPLCTMFVYPAIKGCWSFSHILVMVSGSARTSQGLYNWCLVSIYTQVITRGCADLKWQSHTFQQWHNDTIEILEDFGLPRGNHKIKRCHWQV